MHKPAASTLNAALSSIPVPPYSLSYRCRPLDPELSIRQLAVLSASIRPKMERCELQLQLQTENRKYHSILGNEWQQTLN